MLKIQKIYLNYLESVGKLLDGTPIDRTGLLAITEEVAQTELLIPLIGNFSAGKSSLLNAFLEQDLLAVGLTPETEIATEILYGEEPHLLAFREDGSSERQNVEDLAGLKSRSGEFTHLRIYLDHQRLKALPSLVLVDMPGFGSALTNHNQAISYYLPRGAHFIVVTSVEDGNIVQSLMRQLDELHTYRRSFTFVLNKTNLRSDDDVNNVLRTVSEQIADAFPGSGIPVCIGQDGQQRMQDILDRIDPEKIFCRAFEPRLRDLTHQLINNINAAVNALKRDKVQNEEAQAELNAALRHIERKRDDMLRDLADQRMDGMVDRCVRATGHALESSTEELVEAGASGNKEAFSRIITDVVRGAVTRTIKEEVEGIGKSAITTMQDTLGEFARKVGEVNGDTNWLAELSDRVSRTITQTQDTIGRVGEIFARHANQRPLLPGPTGGQQNVLMTYRSIATILAVTTSVAAPLVEIIIIFLPDILNVLLKGRQRDALREKLGNEIIPSIQSKLREDLTKLLREQVNAMVADISAQFTQEIAEKKQVIDSMTTQHAAQGQQVQDSIDSLITARQTLERLAGDTLYQKGAVT